MDQSEYLVWVYGCGCMGLGVWVGLTSGYAQQWGPDIGAFSSRKRTAVRRLRVHEFQVSRTSPEVRYAKCQAKVSAVQR
jgi:hypothetical protein